MRYKRLNEHYILDEYTGIKLNQKDTLERLNKYEDLLKDEKYNAPRMNDILQLIRYSTEIEIMIRKDLLYEENEYFKTQREAYNKLLNDNQLFIFEENYITNDMMPYLKITIIRRQDKWISKTKH